MASQPAGHAEPVRAAAVDAGARVEPDRDGDGVVDVCDACPDESGLPPDGCPRRVVIEAAEIRISPQLLFPLNGATVMPPGRPILDEVGAVMRAHPEILSLEVSGHASAGERGASGLAQRRADNARSYLVERGVEAARLVARGYGVDAPRVMDATAIGRARNRRVEFRILDAAPPPRVPERPRPVMPAGCPDA
jgi:outer membrane protein OmpA-like peptidoglycan-associated protein